MGKARNKRKVSNRRLKEKWKREKERRVEARAARIEAERTEEIILRKQSNLSQSEYYTWVGMTLTVVFAINWWSVTALNYTEFASLSALQLIGFYAVLAISAAWFRKQCTAWTSAVSVILLFGPIAQGLNILLSGQYTAAIKDVTLVLSPATLATSVVSVFWKDLPGIPKASLGTTFGAGILIALLYDISFTVTHAVWFWLAVPVTTLIIGWHWTNITGEEKLLTVDSAIRTAMVILFYLCQLLVGVAFSLYSVLFLW